MSFFVKYNDNFRFNKLAKFLYLIEYPHTHTGILHYNYILLISIWKLCKNDFEHLPSCKGFLRFEKSKRGYK
jgi:hypothetical protein